MNYLNESKTAYINIPTYFDDINEILTNSEGESTANIKWMMLANVRGITEAEAEYWADQAKIFRYNVIMNDGKIFTPTGKVLGL